MRISDWSSDVCSSDLIIDLRSLPPRTRHPVIFGTLDRMASGKTFVLVNDHDPRPLYNHLVSGYAGDFTWEYVEEGPEVWRVRIGKPDAAGCGCCCGDRKSTRLNSSH